MLENCWVFYNVNIYILRFIQVEWIEQMFPIKKQTDIYLRLGLLKHASPADKQVILAFYVFFHLSFF